MRLNPKWILPLLAGLLMSGRSGRAMDSTDVLPVGVRSPALRAGVIDGVSQKFAADGKLHSLSDVNSTEFDARAISRIEPRVRELISALNQFGRQDLGHQLNLGTLHVHTDPKVRYYAPLFAYGMTERWTVAVGLPVVTYQNKLSLSQTRSNLSEIHAQVRNVSPAIDDAFDQLNVNLVASAQRELEGKGYKPIADRDETVWGDLQLASLYQFHQSRRWIWLAKTIASLPTGPDNDPDDLADLGAFGQPSLEQQALVNYRPFARLTLAAKSSYRWNIPDRVVRRVPESDEDTLPGPERKERLARDTGDAVSAGVSATARVLARVNVGTGYEITRKGSDWYRGDRGYEYGLLSRDTRSEAHRVRAGIDYSSTEAYFRQEAAMPAIVSYEYSDTIRGINTERQTVHELWVTLFF